jgi:hypothetical protein
MTEQEIITMIEEEIKWHKEDDRFDMDTSVEYRIGFLNGLKQILILINANRVG